MTSYTLNLPVQLQQEAEKLATLQGISLDRFILWAVAEYDLSEAQVNEVLAFYAAHCQEIDASIAAEQIIEADNSSALFP